MVSGLRLTPRMAVVCIVNNVKTVCVIVFVFFPLSSRHFCVVLLTLSKSRTDRVNPRIDALRSQVALVVIVKSQSHELAVDNSL